MYLHVCCDTYFFSAREDIYISHLVSLERSMTKYFMNDNAIKQDNILISILQKLWMSKFGEKEGKWFNIHLCIFELLSWGIVRALDPTPAAFGQETELFSLSEFHLW